MRTKNLWATKPLLNITNLNPIAFDVHGKISQMSLESEARGQLGHGYYNIPEGTGERSTLQIGGKSPGQLVEEIASRGLYLDDVWDLMSNPAFTPLSKPTFIELIKLDVRYLGLSGDPTVGWSMQHMLRRALMCRVEGMVLGPCPPEVGPHQRIKDLDQPVGIITNSGDYSSVYYIAHPGIADRNGDPRLFALVSLSSQFAKDGMNHKQRILGTSKAGSEQRYGSGNEFIFALRDPEPVRSWHPRPARSLHIGINVW